MSERSEQELVRLAKLTKLREYGYPFPNDVKLTGTAHEVLGCAAEETSKGEAERRSFRLAGRLMAIRLMGKAAFAHLQDASGRVQIYVRRDDIGEEAFAAFKSFDLGDIVEVEGFAFLTKTSEPSLHARFVRLLVKCLRPLPEKWHGLADVELRYRQRYLDLIANPDVRETFVRRSKIIAGVRKFFNERGYVEVETPIMSSVASGASARPFVTHHNALDMDLHLRIALELPLKRLVVGGIERVYEIGRVFRNEGISTEHNPEFTMIEFYQAYATYETLMDLTEELVVELADTVIGSRKIQFGELEIDLARPWKRVTMLDAIHEIGGVDRSFDLNELSGVHAAAHSLGYDDLLDQADYGKVLFEIFDRHVQHRIVNPTFIIRHPTSISPLARQSTDDARFTDRFELMVAGIELANAFSELNDAEDQRRRFEEQAAAKQAGDEEAMGMDVDFIRALEFGMPPTAGQGIGIDRLVMLLTGSTSIRDVILFPQMRPESGETD